MTKRCVALVASAVFVLVGLAIILTVRPSPTLTIRCSNVTVIGGGVHPTLEISNTHQGHSRSFPQLGTIRRGTLPRMPKFDWLLTSRSQAPLKRDSSFADQTFSNRDPFALSDKDRKPSERLGQPC